MSLVATRNGKIVLRKDDSFAGHHVRLIPKADRIVVLSQKDPCLKRIQDSMHEYSFAKSSAVSENWMVR